MSTWKTVERKVAALLGGKRLGPTGIPQPDVVTDWLVVECKHRNALPDWLRDAVTQARAQADDEHLAIVILHEKQMRYKDSLVVLRLGDWLEWFGGGGKHDVG